MTHKLERADVIAGTAQTIETIAANYRCGHCPSHTRLVQDCHGNPHVATYHHDGCPVLSGAVSSIPDTFRAATTAVVPEVSRER